MTGTIGAIAACIGLTLLVTVAAMLLGVVIAFTIEKAVDQFMREGR